MLMKWRAKKIKTMQYVISIIKDNLRQILETLLLIVGWFVSYYKVAGCLDYLKEKFLPNMSNLLEAIIMHILDMVPEKVIVVFTVLLIIRLLYWYNKDFTMNQKNYYHDYPYFWYWYCRNILGIKKCNLVLVPIHMQFKLVIDQLFEEFPLDEGEYPETEDARECKVTKNIFKDKDGEINLILEDTYLIDNNQIPHDKQDLPTIKISRNDGKNMGRYFSQTFINTVINEVRSLPNRVRINIYATTNPMNTLNIAQRVFKIANRGNIEHLYVYQQENTGNRIFKSDEHKIY